ncbi:MAG: ABC transporter ATP-binding protein/permease [Bacteroidales bacterium]|nr:ABC transporter ATP-binding protein/permease [Bacteroidales bacterium]
MPLVRPHSSTPRLRAIIAAYRWQFALFALLTAAMVALTMATALSVSDFLKLLFGDDGTGTATSQGNVVAQWLGDLYSWLATFGQMMAIVLFSVLLLGVYTFKNIFSYLSALSIAALRAKVVRDVRLALFARVLRLPASYYATHRKGDILARFGADVVEYDESVLGSLQSLLAAVVSVVMYMAMLFFLNLKLTVFVLAMLPIIAVIIAGLSRRLRRRSKEVQEQNAYLTALTEEAMSGLKVIKAYTAIEFCNSRFQQCNRRYAKRRTSMFWRIDAASPLSEFLGSAVVMGILLFGSWLVMSGDHGLTPELFVSYIMLFVLMIPPTKDISTATAQIKKGRACADRLEALLAEPVEDLDGLPFAGLQDRIELRDVSFSYDGVTPVLDHVSLTLPRGRTVAVVGSSGSGKSTIAALLAKFYEPQGGSITFDDKPLHGLGSGQVRRAIGMVSQDTDLFHTTVAANIAFGRPEASMQQIVDAAKVAGAHDFIEALPQGYLTDIGQGGSSLSGGQRQRLSIARAVLADPSILILDEATSALDTESERNVQQALGQAMRGRTCLVIAHRLSTVTNADEIVVLERGRVVQNGTHAELMATPGRYRDLVNMQQL